MAKPTGEISEPFTLPRARMINGSIFAKSAFQGKRQQGDAKATPKYSIEIAYDKNDPALDFIEDKLREYADAVWGEGAGDDDNLVLPLIEGNKLKRKREKNGKPGDAYADTIVIRAKTIYNKDGEDGPGGIEAYDEDVEPLTATNNQGRLYNGCYVETAVTIRDYETNDGEDALQFYLVAVQKVGDGEKLTSTADRSSMFQPIKRSKEERARGRAERRHREDDNDEDPATMSDRNARRSRRSRDEDDEPRRSRRSRDDDEEPRRSRRSRDDDEEPRRSRRSRDVDLRKDEYENLDDEIPF